MYKKLYSVLLCISIIFASYTTYADKQADLDKQKQENRNSIKSIQGKISESEKEKSVHIDKKKDLDNKLEKANFELSKLNNQISTISYTIMQKQGEIEKLTGEESQANDLFKERMRTLYEDNSYSYVDVVLNSGSISDLFYRLDVIKQVSDYDQKVIEDIVYKKEKVQEAKTVMETQKKEVEVVKTSAQKKKNEIVALEAETQSTINQINSDIEQAKKEQAKLENENKRIESQIKAILDEANRKSAVKSTYSGGIMQWPCPGYGRGSITSQFGNRVHPIFKTTKYHSGIDIGASGGSNVVAANEGTVIVSTYSSSYGNYIVINHGGGITTTYAHLSSRLVSVGATVTKSQSIGKVGSTGWSTGPHLHFEVMINGTRQNPLNYV